MPHLKEGYTRHVEAFSSDPGGQDLQEWQTNSFRDRKPSRNCAHTWDYINLGVSKMQPFFGHKLEKCKERVRSALLLKEPFQRSKANRKESSATR